MSICVVAIGFGESHLGGVGDRMGCDEVGDGEWVIEVGVLAQLLELVADVVDRLLAESSSLKAY